ELFRERRATAWEEDVGDDLRGLAARGVIAGAEGAVVIAYYRPGVIQSLYPYVERRAFRHVGEVRPALRVDRHTGGLNHDFAYLASRSGVAWAEVRAVLGVAWLSRPSARVALD